MDKSDEHLDQMEWLCALRESRAQELEIYKSKDESKKLSRPYIGNQVMSELEREIAYFDQLIAAQKKK